MTISIPRSKTDVYREGNIVYVNSVDSEYCPVNLVKKYMTAAGTSSESNLPLFRPLIYYKKSNSYSLRSSKLSYSRCREVFKSCLKELGLIRSVMVHTVLDQVVLLRSYIIVVILFQIDC